jgi:hypothetical protein
LAGDLLSRRVATPTVGPGRSGICSKAKLRIHITNAPIPRNKSSRPKFDVALALWGSCCRLAFEQGWLRAGRLVLPKFSSPIDSHGRSFEPSSSWAPVDSLLGLSSQYDLGPRNAMRNGKTERKAMIRMIRCWTLCPALKVDAAPGPVRPGRPCSACTGNHGRLC